MIKIDLNTLININKLVCEQTGEISNVINKSNLQSALSVLDNNYYDNDHELLAALVRSVIIGHGFEDGNKRTGMLLLLIFGNINISEDELYDITIEIATNKLKDVKEISRRIWNG